MQWELHLPADMCGSKADSNMASPRQGPIEEVSGDHLLSPPSGGSPQGEHLHRAVLGRDLNAAGEHHCVLPHQEAYCALLRGGEHSPRHRPPGGEQQEQPRFLPPPTPLPTAPCALTQQPLNASTQFDLESAMAQLQAQNSALLNHLAIQQQQTKGTPEGPRPSQYPILV